jgi:hypothetical protein
MDTHHLSISARGFWFELLLIMHSSPRRGYLLNADSSPITREQIQRKLHLTTDEVTALDRELVEAGVYTRTQDGVVYSRRMVREEAKKADWRKSKSDSRLDDLVSKYCPNDVCSNSNSNSNSISNKKADSNSVEPPRTDQDKLQLVLDEHRKRGVKVDDELRKMRAWLATKPNRRMTLRFITNWLNKVEGSITIPATKRPQPKSSCASDPAWKRMGFSDRLEWEKAGSPYD